MMGWIVLFTVLAGAAAASDPCGAIKTCEACIDHVADGGTRYLCGWCGTSCIGDQHGSPVDDCGCALFSRRAVQILIALPAFVLQAA